MSIDEAIKWQKEQALKNYDEASWHCEKVAKSMIKIAEEHEQIAEWLEELKVNRRIQEDDLTDAYLLGKYQGRADAIEFISDKLIYPLLDEYDRGLWEHINYIELAKEWIKVLDDNPYPKVKNHTEARKRDLRQWMAEQLGVEE